jgi:hypothetical protein
MAEKARHAFGTLEKIDEALSTGIIDQFDILFVKDANGKPYVGWIDKEGKKVIVEDKIQIVRVDELPTTDGDENVVYIYNNEGYIWDSVSSQCVPLAKSADLTTLETQVSELVTRMDNKVDAEAVQTMVDTAVEAAVEEATSMEVVEF